MRTLRFLPLLVIALHLSAAGMTGMTDEDREHLLVHFEMTGQMWPSRCEDFQRLSSNTAPPPIAGLYGSAFLIWRSPNLIIGAI